MSQSALDFLAEQAAELNRLRAEALAIRRHQQGIEADSRSALIAVFGDDIGQHITLSEAITILRRMDHARLTAQVAAATR